MSHHRRRYTAGSLRRALAEAGFAVDRTSYFNTILFPPIAAVRLGRRLLRARATRQSDFDVGPAALNRGSRRRLRRRGRARRAPGPAVRRVAARTREEPVTGEAVRFAIVGVIQNAPQRGRLRAGHRHRRALPDRGRRGGGRGAGGELCLQPRVDVPRPWGAGPSPGSALRARVRVRGRARGGPAHVVRRGGRAAGDRGPGRGDPDRRAAQLPRSAGVGVQSTSAIRGASRLEHPDRQDADRDEDRGRDQQPHGAAGGRGRARRVRVDHPLARQLEQRRQRAECQQPSRRFPARARAGTAPASRRTAPSRRRSR